jgi:8-oxo-dGTP pyrophosphatase MutT (NUDIX family)
MNPDCNIHIICRALIIQNDYLLCCYNPYKEQRYYFLPGGHQETNESAEECVKRELKEELGIDFQIEEVSGFMEYRFKREQILSSSKGCNHEHEYNIVFKMNLPLELNKNIEHNVDSYEEFDAFKWIKIDEIDQHDIRPKELIYLIKEWNKTKKIFWKSI